MLLLRSQLQTLARIFGAGLACALMLAPAASGGDGKDQQTYCAYVIEQASAQRDLLLTPSAIAGFTQPNTGLPTQSYWGFTGSLSDMRKAGLTMDVARKDCELYGASTSAQQEIQYAMPSLEKQALQHRLELIQQAMTGLDALVADAAKMVDAQNMTRPMAFALQTTKIKLEADRADTQSKIAAIYAPALGGKPLKDLVAEKQADEESERRANSRLTRQNNWDVALSVGAHQQINPANGAPAPYGEVTVSYNLASHAIDKHLDESANAYADWKRVQEGDVIRNAEVLKEQTQDAISVQDNRLKALLDEKTQIQSNLQLVSDAQTTAALDFRNQLTTAQLVLEIEIGDASFRLALLKDFLQKNF